MNRRLVVFSVLAVAVPFCPVNGEIVVLKDITSKGTVTITGDSPTLGHFQSVFTADAKGQIDFDADTGAGSGFFFYGSDGEAYGRSWQIIGETSAKFKAGEFGRGEAQLSGNDPFFTVGNTTILQGTASGQGQFSFFKKDGRKAEGDGSGQVKLQDNFNPDPATREHTIQLTGSYEGDIEYDREQLIESMTKLIKDTIGMVGGRGQQAEFTPRFGLDNTTADLDYSAAEVLGFDHFNALQRVESVVLPTNAPPLWVSRGQAIAGQFDPFLYGDNPFDQPWYYDEASSPTPWVSWSDMDSGSLFQFQDVPRGWPVGTIITFSTVFAGIGGPLGSQQPHGGMIFSNTAWRWSHTQLGVDPPGGWGYANIDTDGLDPGNAATEFLGFIPVPEAIEKYTRLGFAVSGALPVVPEPSTFAIWSVIGLGLIVVGRYRRGRNRIH